MHNKYKIEIYVGLGFIALIELSAWIFLAIKLTAE